MKISLRNMEFSTSAVKSVDNAALVPEVSHALKAWVKQSKGSIAPGILIGGLALSFYVRPRETTDVDMLFLTSGAVPEQVPGFKKHRANAFQEHDTHVEIEICTPASIKLPLDLVQKVYKTSVVHDGLRVASLEALIALKLYGADTKRRELGDLADVVRLLEAHPHVDMVGWPLKPWHVVKLEDAKERARS